jgi:hypothetical protein
MIMLAPEEQYRLTGVEGEGTWVKDERGLGGLIFVSLLSFEFLDLQLRLFTLLDRLDHSVPSH